MQANFLQISEEVHCLYCHLEYPRKDIFEHNSLHTQSKITTCHEDICPDWALKIFKHL